MKCLERGVGIWAFFVVTGTVDTNDSASNIFMPAQVRRLRRHGFTLRIKAVEKIHGLLCVRCRAEDGAFVIFEDG